MPLHDGQTLCASKEPVIAGISETFATDFDRATPAFGGYNRSAKMTQSARSDTPLLRFDNITKSFFGVLVLKGVSFTLGAGRVLGLVGENGAGKSTLMNALGGVLPPDSGAMFLGGRPYAPRSTRDAARHGVAFIHQELNLFANLSIAENMHVPAFPLRKVGPVPVPVVDRAAMRRTTAALLEAVDLRRRPDTPVEELSPGERQLVEIAKALKADARLVILDEPTTSLTTHEADRLFGLMGRLKSRGVSMVYISHRLQDVLRLCDDAVVLRDGQVVGEGVRESFTLEKMISLMVGRTIEQLFPPRSGKPWDEPVLEVAGLTRAGVVEDATFTLRKGEVLGLSGLMGSGRTELARMVFGLDSYDRGRIVLDGRPLHPSPRHSIWRGVAFLTEDRRAEGLLMDASVSDNASLVHLPSFAAPLVKWVRARRVAREVDRVSAGVRLAGAATREQPVKTLSGGNQQKVVLGKWLLGGPANAPLVFILDEPTRGVDVGAKHELYKIINGLADAGTGVLLISSELEELLGLCNRILVMSGGRLRGEFAAGAFDRERILAAAFAGGDARDLASAGSAVGSAVGGAEGAALR